MVQNVSRNYPDTSYLPSEHRCYLSEEAHYYERITQERPMVFIRPGCRVDEEHSLYLRSDREGNSFLACIAVPGSHETKVPPVISATIPVRVQYRECISIAQLTTEHCNGMYREIVSPATALAWLQSKYPALSLDDTSEVTVYTIAYV